MSRQSVIAGNWKMYKTIEEAKAFIEAISSEVLDSENLVCLAVPYTAISEAAKLAENSNILIGAQNMNDSSEGAFTGEISGKMLLEAGCEFVVLGHSERRAYFHESNAFINRKVKRALESGLKVILCVGETLEERESGKMEELLGRQLKGSLLDIEGADFKDIIIAYEPVWAIGTGKTATPAIADEAHKYCRSIIKELFGEAIAEQVQILYGGSVKPSNVKDLMVEENIDGALVGGASLKPESFVELVNFNK